MTALGSGFRDVVGPALVVALVVCAAVTPALGGSVGPVPGSAGATAQDPVPGTTRVSDCRTIDSPGTYTLTENVDGTRSPCIEITADNVTLDGRGHRVRHVGSDAAGTTGVLVDVRGLSPSVRVENVVARNWGRGVAVTANNATLADVTAHDNRYGVVLEGASDATLRRVTAYFNRFDGVYAEDSRFVAVHDSTLYTNERHGVFFNRSDDALLEDTRTYDHPAGDGVLFVAAASGRLVDTNATANVNGVRLRAGSDGTDLVGTHATDNRRDGVVVVDSRDVTLSGTNASLNERAGVHLDGAAGAYLADTTAVENRGSGPGEGFGLLVRNGSTDARFSGTVARENGREGVLVLFTDGTTFTDTTARANGRRGVYLRESDDARLADLASVANEDTGVRVDLARNVTLVDVNASANRPPPPSGAGTTHGVLVRDSSHVALRTATVTDNNGSGVLAETASSFSVRDATVSRNDRTGVLLRTTRRGSSAHVSVVNARVRDNGGDGLHVINHRNVTVRGVNASLNRVDGFVLAAARGQVRDAVSLRDSVAVGNGDDGLVAARLRDLSVVRATLSRNGNRGARLDEVTDGRVVDSTLANNVGNGIRATNLTNGTVADSRIRGNFGDGIWVENGSDVALVGNHVSANDYPGLVVTNVSGGLLRDNRVADSDLSGIEVVDSDGATLRNNTVTGTDPRPDGTLGVGVALYDSDDVTLADTAVRDNADDGFHLEGSDDARFRGGTARNNSGWAVALRKGSHNVTATGLRFVPAGGDPRSTPTTLDFDASNVSLRPDATPAADPGGLSNVGVYVDVRRTNDVPSLTVTAHYRAVDASNVDEATVRPWYYDRPTATWHRFTAPNRTDPAADETFVDVPRGRLLDPITLVLFGRSGGGRVADYGDAPDPPYRSLAESDGARHNVTAHEWLGPTVTREFDARTPNDDADDGVTFARDSGGLTLSAAVTTADHTSDRYAADPADRLYVSVWVDADGDGWDDDPAANASVDPSTWEGDQRTLALATGRRVDTEAWVRVRLGYGSPVTEPTGAVEFGEVEDYHLVALTVRANESTVAPGEPVALTVRRADTNETVNATVAVGDATLQTGDDGRAVYTPTANGTVVATATASAATVTFLNGTARVEPDGSTTGEDGSSMGTGGETSTTTSPVSTASLDRNGDPGIQITEVAATVELWAAGDVDAETVVAVVEAWDGT